MAPVTDPVCGTKVDSGSAAAQTTYEGQVYFFCSEECRRRFEHHPKESLKNAERPPSTSGA
jgi:YHS domain-containing protein